MPSKLPVPEGWHRGPMIIRRGFAVALIAGTAAWLIVALNRGELLTAAVSAGFLVVELGFTTTFALAQAGWVSVRAAYDESGTTLTEDRRLALLRVASAIVAIPTCVAFFVFGFRHQLDMPFSGTDMGVHVLIAVGMTLLFSVLLVWMFLGSQSARITLTPSGYRLPPARNPSVGTWADVEDVTARLLIGNLEITLRGPDEAAVAIDNAERYTPKGAPLYWMIRFYWSNPALRAELVTGAAVERLADRRFPVS